MRALKRVIYFCCKLLSLSAVFFLTVINASAAVTLLEQRPEKIQALSGIRTHDLCDASAVLSQLSYQSHMRSTGRNRMFQYFWNVAETCSPMVPLYLRLAETWKFKSAWFRQVSGTEMSSHVSVIFKPADVSANGSAVVCYIHQSINARWFFEQQWILTF